MQGKKVELTEKQTAWLVLHFKHTPNKEICETLGIKDSTMHRFARKLGLRKSPQFIRAKQQAGLERMWRYNYIHDYETQRRYGKRLKPGFGRPFQKGERCVDRIGEEREKERIRKSVESRRKTFKLERARALFGLPRETKLKVLCQPKQKVMDRYYLKKRGYVIDEEALVAYWTQDTLRCRRLEAAPKRFYEFKDIAHRHE